ncbi:L,D-transpeptidase family protein [Caulobacter sp. SLTY]|nr:L,D-transpeptidase family protein [Caulobacter sp. SLTY]
MGSGSVTTGRRVGAVAFALMGVLGMAALGPASAQPQPYRPGGPATSAATAINPTPEQAAQLRRALDNAQVHGFPVGAFTPRGNDNAALVAATLRYAKAVRTGRLPTSGFRQDWGLRPGAYDPAPGLAQAVASNRVQAWLNSLAPPYTGYQTLQKGLVQYREIRDRGGWSPLANVDLKPGATGPAVEALRERLAMEDPAVPEVTRVAPAGAPAGAARTIAVYDEAMAEAVSRAQRRFGYQPTGVLTAGIRAQLNVPVQQRIEQILANMERWRWLPQVLPEHRIQVNIADARLTVFEGDQPTMSMRAVTGKPGSETPMLHSTIHSIVLNPPWNVPAGIARNELLPKGRGYLAANGFRILPGGGLQQAPGPGSALGLIKFDFQNPYAVYLHDTPSKGRFASYSRLASHGCVRLEKPLALARHVLAGDPYWTPEQIDATIAGGKTTRAQVQRPVDVFLLYWTAYVTNDGQVNFRADPYGWDGLLMQRIAAAGGAVA